MFILRKLLIMQGERKMFENIGQKIKGVAKTVFGIGVAISVISGFGMMSDGSDIGFFVMLLGALGSYLGTMMFYGIGQLIENTDILVKHFVQNSDVTHLDEQKVE